jgi:hypothetical protein
MAKFKELEEFESRFETMNVSELRHWKDYWTQYARLLAPKVQKEAMRRVHRIDKAIHERTSGESDS